MIEHLNAQVVFDRLVKSGQLDDPGIDHALMWCESWHAHYSRLAERMAAGEALDGRASIYTGETYAEARDRYSELHALIEEYAKNDAT